jgi:ASC-1-like (ASCH) protein
MDDSLNDSSGTAPYRSAHDLPSFVEMRQQLKAFRALTLFVLRGKRSEIADLETRMNQMADRVDAFYDRLGSHHWVFNDWMNVGEIDAILDETSTTEEAEHRLIELYRDTEATKWHLLRLRGVPGLRERHHLLVRAREDYDAGRFDACTLLLISVMDGFVNDFEASERQGLAARDTDEMVAWDSVTGHHLGLTNALKPFLKTIKKRIDEEVFEVHRHGIVHGSVVNFNNVVVATKAWNLLFAVVDWSIATTKKATEDAKPPPPTLRETFGRLAEHGRKKKARELFEPWTISRESEAFDSDEVVVQSKLFFEAWQKKQWGRLVPLMPPQLIGQTSVGQAAEYTKSWFDMREVSEVVLERVEYTESSVAEARGKATIDGTTRNLRLRWVRYDNEGNLALNHEAGSWHLAVVAPHRYLVVEGDERQN